MNSLLGVKLRSPFAAARSLLGIPDTVHYSPPDEGDRFGSYTWRARGIAVLTWLADEGEIVWGVRLDAAGDPDPALGFTVGSRRGDVLARFPGVWREGEDVLEADLEDGRLVVSLRENRVCSIQVIGPMGQPGDEE